MQLFLMIAAMLHASFMITELFPWSRPVVLRLTSRRLPAGESLTPAQENLVSGVIHNAGIYNGIVAGGLLFAVFEGAAGMKVAEVMFAGATVAGIFGAITLKSKVPLIQALIGAAGLYLVLR